ncbi:MAG: ATP--guanido phosphotransferase [Megasphaera sp.]|jgi:protein arginine kinase|nr:ATP--guanido phosphotransferase [Megasphaera sp.]MCH4187277.1 ATP--guanido phosphotransferase [Megasphaera sp.]MCH4217243.1 ATP--guanido phosphotransferase [Megasphaera sp.]
MVDTLLTTPLSPWQDGSGNMADIVLDSRVRLVRNLKQYVFPCKASAAELAAVAAEGKKMTGQLNAIGKGVYEYTDLMELTPLQRELLVVKHFSSAAHIREPANRGILLRNDGAVSVMVNEDDHFCIQTAAAGLDLQKVWQEAAQVDDTMESHLNFAFRDDFGYLTASPSMTGTGLITGVTLHLPALVLMKRLNRIVQGITKFGFTICGMYGERNECIGNVFQVTNQITLGVSEVDVLDQLEKIVTQIVTEERNCRSALLTHSRDSFTDKFLRSYGILANAWLMEEREAISLLSDLRMAADMNIAHVRPLAYEALMTASEAAFLQARAGRELSDDERQHQRAQVLQEVLAAYAR